MDSSSEAEANPLDRLAADAAVKLLVHLFLAAGVAAVAADVGRIAAVGRVAIWRANGGRDRNLAQAREIIALFHIGSSHVRSLARRTWEQAQFVFIRSRGTHKGQIPKHKMACSSGGRRVACFEISSIEDRCVTRKGVAAMTRTLDAVQPREIVNREKRIDMRSETAERR
jgi:hypothetical protein